MDRWIAVKEEYSSDFHTTLDGQPSPTHHYERHNWAGPTGIPATGVWLCFPLMWANPFTDRSLTCSEAFRMLCCTSCGEGYSAKNEFSLPKTNMEPENHLFQKENHLPNLQFLCSILVFAGGVLILQNLTCHIEDESIGKPPKDDILCSCGVSLGGMPAQYGVRL